MLNIKRFLPKNPKTRKTAFIIADMALIAFAFWFAFFLRFDGRIPNTYPDQYYQVLKMIIILAWFFIIPVFYSQKLYSFSWSYVSSGELISLIGATTLSFLFLTITLYVSAFFPFFKGFPRSTLVISYFLVVSLCGGIRISKRVYLQLFKKNNIKIKSNVLIVGAGDAGEQIARNILASKNSAYELIGFVDDNSSKQGVIIHGKKVLGKIEDILALSKKMEIKELIIALPSANSETIRGAVELGRKAGIKKIKIVPTVSEMISGEITLKNLREVQVEDLLGREPVFLDVKAIENLIKGKKVLITGAAGSIGSELCRQTAKFEPSVLIIFDQDETGVFNISRELEDKFPFLKINSIVGDIKNKGKINKVFELEKPNIVFHAAAYKHVPLMEKNFDEAIKNNVFGTKNVAEASLNFGAEKFIFISTDKAVNPVSIMGFTKRAGEIICRMLCQKNGVKFISVRFGNVLDSRGSVIPIFREQIRKGGPVEVTHPEMKRYFMLTSEAVLLVMQAGAMGQGGEVFVLDMGKPIKILELAKEMIRFSGFEPDKDMPIVFTEPRPGEKLFEEILTAEEGTVATKNQKIFSAKTSDLALNEKKLEYILNRLKNIADNGNKEEIIKIFREMIYGAKQ